MNVVAAQIETWDHAWLTPHKKKAMAYLDAAGGPGSTPDFTKWLGDPGLALVCYAQLADRFGWDAFKRVMAMYLNPANGQGLRAVGHGEGLDEFASDEAKMAAWIERWSAVTECDTAPFFAGWGWPTHAVIKSEASQAWPEFAESRWRLAPAPEGS